MDAPTPFKRAAGDIDRALVIRNLRKEYRAGAPVLKDVSLTIAGRGMTAIIGPSGTGKSTLVRCINRLVDPTSGEVLFLGQDLARLRGRHLREARRRIGMVFQEYNLVERLSDRIIGISRGKIVFDGPPGWSSEKPKSVPSFCAWASLIQSTARGSMFR